MSIAVYSQLISIYDKSPDGLLIVRGRIIQHANRAICDAFQTDITERLIFEVLSDELVHAIKHEFENGNTAFFPDEIIAQKHFSVTASALEDGYIIVLRAIHEDKKNQEKVEFSAQTIRVLGLLFRDPIMTITAALETLVNKMPSDVYENLRKYFEIINQRCYTALKSAEMICEEAEYIHHVDTNMRLGNNDIVALVKRVIECTNASFDSENVKIKIGEAPDKLIVACNLEKMERALLCVISALFQHSKAQKRIVVNISKTDNQTLIRFQSNGESWDKQYIQFIHKKRVEYLGEDIQKYGYSMLRVMNILTMHGGNVFVETPETGGNCVILVLPDSKVPIMMEENLDPWRSKRSVLTELSGVLPRSAYHMKRKRKQSRED